MTGSAVGVQPHGRMELQQQTVRAQVDRLEELLRACRRFVNQWERRAGRQRLECARDLEEVLLDTCPSFFRVEVDDPYDD